MRSLIAARLSGWVNNLLERRQRLEQNHYFRFFLKHQATLRFLTLIPILALGYSAHQNFTSENSMTGFILAAIATALLAVVAWPAPITEVPSPAIRARPQIRSDWRRMLGATWLVGSAIMLAQAFEIFYGLQIGEIPSRLPWDYFAIGWLMLALGAWTLLRGAPIHWRSRPWHLILLGGIVLLALYFRLTEFDSIPFGLWYDEAINGLEARRMLQNTTYRPTFVANMTQIHLWLYKTALDIFGETSIEALRVTSVAFGVLSVIVGYMVGSQMRGPWFGILLAFFLAVMRWAVNFSRIAMTGIETAFFTLLAFYFLVRVLRYHRWQDAAWLGMSIGLGLWFYSAFRFMILALAGYAILKSPFWRPRIIGLGVLVVAVALATTFPLLIFINTDTDAFMARSRQVNILDPANRTSESLDAALWHNIEHHALMFHVSGDRNGRHNLPGEPMLDPVMGILMLMGLGLALRGLHQPENSFFVLVLLFGLLPGILTLEFEAPQGLRTIGVLPAIGYFCALSTYAIARILTQSRYSRSLLGILVAVLLLSAQRNYDTYFEEQARDFDAWHSFSAVPTIMGQYARTHADNAQFYFSPLISYDPSTRFVAPEISNRQQTLRLPDAFPLRVEPETPVVVYLDTSDRWLWQEANRLYPSARFSAITAQDYGFLHDDILFYEIVLQPEDLRSLQGLGTDGRGVLYIPEYGEYRLSTDFGASLYLNGRRISARDSLLLAQGDHLLRVEPPNSALEWRTPDDYSFSPVPAHYLYHDPVSPAGLASRFYEFSTRELDAGTLPADPAALLKDLADSTTVADLERIDPTLDSYFHELPMARPYGVVWRGWLRIEQTGDYGFSLRAIEWAELRIDGDILLTTSEPNQTIYTRQELVRGRHFVEVLYLDTTSHSRIHLLWQPPGEPHFTTIPPGSWTPFQVVVQSP
ncbi:MAG: hypothetical protein GYB66_16815 [Chloroflexi bacterium]|nr:hypothetical protein [Chloroflexota bacterium]